MFEYIFETASFLPHGICLSWRPDLILLHAVSDILIFSSYLSIPIALIYFKKRRKDLKFRGAFTLFALFILACSMTHFMGLLTLWFPYYGAQGLVKALTASVSVLTAVAIWPIIPKALAIPSTKDIQQKNEELTREIFHREKIERELLRSHRLLESKVLERTRELEFSEARFRDFAEISADWFWEQDEELKFNFISAPDSSTDISSLNKVLGKTRFETGVVNLTRKQINKHLDTLKNKKPFSKLHLARKLNNGETYHVEISGIPLFDTNGEFTGYRGTGKDITEIVNTETKMVAERDRANNANQAKSSFLAHMSHELRTPLNAIIGFSNLIYNETFGPISNPKYKEYINDIHNSGNYLLELISDILDLTMVESGESKLHEEKCDLFTIVSRCLRMCDARLREKSIEVTVNSPKEKMWLMADRRMVKQVILNILSNSIKYGNTSGGIKISFWVKEDIGIEISDNGIGISENNIKTIFEPFRRVEDDVLRPADGVGLGLPISQKFMQLHSGNISIASQKNVGSKVLLTFPLTRYLPVEDTT